MKKLIELNESNYHLMNDILLNEHKYRPKDASKFTLLKENEDSEYYSDIRYWLCHKGSKLNPNYYGSIMYILGKESQRRQNN